MRHLTRKRLRPAGRGAAALGLATVLAAGGGAAAWADATAGDGALGGFPVGDMVGGGGSIGGGSVGGGGIDHVDKPFGQIVRIIPDVGTTAILFLPALPVLDGEGFLPGPLETISIERAYADEPDAWEHLGTLAWDDDWREYNTPDGNLSLAVEYADDQWTIVSYCAVHFSSDTVDYRDFYLRATAVTKESGVLTTTEFEPALIAYEGEWRPDPDDPDDEPPAVVNPPEADTGDSGGNRGGAVQGESERVDPGAAAPGAQGAETVPGAGGGARRADGSAAGAGETSENGSADGAGEGGEGKAGAAGGATPAEGESAQCDAAPAGGVEQVPGFVWAVGATAGAVGVAGGAVAVLHARRRPRRSAGKR